MTMELAELLELLREDIRGMGSPWVTREGAAAYLGCSVGEIDKAANEGRLPRQYFLSSPRYKKADLDKLVTKQKQPLAIRLRERQERPAANTNGCVEGRQA